MAKCDFCRSCLKVVNVSSGDYLACFLCKTVYKVVDGKLNVIIDSEVIKEIGSKYGWKIVL